MKNEALADAPRDRHILVLNKIYHFVDYGKPYRCVGSYWVEAWHDGKEWRLWCGTERTHTTEDVDAEAWAELPA